MSMDKVVVTELDVKNVSMPTESATPVQAKLPSPIPLWSRVLLSLSVLCLPLLCLLALILRVVFRAQSPRVKLAWTSFLSTLLIISGGIGTIQAGLLFAFMPSPALVSASASDLDERTQFPVLPRAAEMTSAEVSSQLKPIVVVISPSVNIWHRGDVRSSAFGAGSLLYADKNGYLIITAKHVVETGNGFLARSTHRAMVATSSGMWASAEVVAEGKDLDLALLWIPRASGSGSFVQPVHAAVDGENVYVIGHPEGLKFTLSTGIVSSIRDNTVQVSAPISPGNSGGPVFDNHGNLIAVVSAKFDRSHDVNAENLGFAVKADALLRLDTWNFLGKGKQYFDAYGQSLKTIPHQAAGL